MHHQMFVLFYFFIFVSTTLTKKNYTTNPRKEEYGRLKMKQKYALRFIYY